MKPRYIAIMQTLVEHISPEEIFMLNDYFIESHKASSQQAKKETPRGRIHKNCKTPKKVKLEFPGLGIKHYMNKTIEENLLEGFKYLELSKDYDINETAEVCFL